MPLVVYEPDVKRYEEVFSHVQGGGNPMVRYRGSTYQNGSGFPQILKSLIAKIASFAKPILSAAAPHARRAFEAAEPHLREAATTAAKDVTNRAREALSQKFATLQEGQGRKRLARKSYATKRIRRIPPVDLPDFI